MRIFTGFAAMLCMALVLVWPGLAQSQDGGPLAVETVVLETAEGGVLIAAEMATTPQARERGLMFRHRLAPDRGMLFVYDAPQPVAMWMKNTNIALDIIFIRADGVVVGIAENAVPQSEEMIESPEPALSVLEVAAGTVERIGLAIGDRVVHPVFGNLE
ncbi:MAG: DUF192 domain-containing protein [Aestuariivirgaceae bacterium]|nr:DUF192 domain-containing protein [Aestuariivirgaceae bacterium]